MRYVLSRFDYDGKKETSTLLTPDPNIVMRYYRSNFQIDYLWTENFHFQN